MTAAYPARAALRECRLYRFYVEHPLTGQEVLGYVGETVREPFERLTEHVQSQPWMDTVTRWERDPRVYHGKDAVLAAEAAAIRAEKPLYNVVGNERNGDRIPPPLAIRQRRARDAETGGPRWAHPDDRCPQRPQTARRPATSKLPARPRQTTAPRWLKAVGWWVASWAASTLTGWPLLVHWRLATGTHALTCAALLLPAAVAAFAAVLSKTAAKRTRRTVWRRLAGRAR